MRYARDVRYAPAREYGRRATSRPIFRYIRYVRYPQALEYGRDDDESSQIQLKAKNVGRGHREPVLGVPTNLVNSLQALHDGYMAVTWRLHDYYMTAH